MSHGRYFVCTVGRQSNRPLPPPWFLFSFFSVPASPLSHFPPPKQQLQRGKNSAGSGFPIHSCYNGKVKNQQNMLRRYSVPSCTSLIGLALPASSFSLPPPPTPALHPLLSPRYPSPRLSPSSHSHIRPSHAHTPSCVSYIFPSYHVSSSPSFSPSHIVNAFSLYSSTLSAETKSLPAPWSRSTGPPIILYCLYLENNILF